MAYIVMALERVRDVGVLLDEAYRVLPRADQIVAARIFVVHLAITNMLP